MENYDLFNVFFNGERILVEVPYFFIEDYLTQNEIPYCRCMVNKCYCSKNKSYYKGGLN